MTTDTEAQNKIPPEGRLTAHRTLFSNLNPLYSPFELGVPKAGLRLFLSNERSECDSREPKGDSIHRKEVY